MGIAQSQLEKICSEIVKEFLQLMDRIEEQLSHDSTAVYDRKEKDE